MDESCVYNEWEGSRYARNRSAAQNDEEDDDDEDEETHTDDGPLLSDKYDKYRRYPTYTGDSPDDRPRRSALGTVIKFSLFCTAMILFCVLMYIPMYNRVLDNIPKDMVAGWNINVNRDTKIYVQPKKVTTIHEPRNFLKGYTRKNKLYLLIFVCAATENFERRLAIRNTWGSMQNYIKLNKVRLKVREKYKNYNFTYNLYPEDVKVNSSEHYNRTKRRAGLMELIPKIGEVLKLNEHQLNNNEPKDEVRFTEDEKQQDFDMNTQFDEENEVIEYDYDTNVMKIPPKGSEVGPSLDKVMKVLKNIKLNELNVNNDNELKVKDELNDNEVKIDSEVNVGGVENFKLVFLLGLPKVNDTDTQVRIDEESRKYGDIIQESFADTYNNLTLKSIMMLKWVNAHCEDKVRYVLKADDDIYLNVPHLVETLKNKSKEFDAKKNNRKDKKEYLLIGDLIYGAKPVLDATNKWFSPRYMYGGRVYPKYLSGTGYAFSIPTAKALYHAALSTPYFHLEDVFITGMCALRSTPPCPPSPGAGFSSRAAPSACAAHAHVSAHHASALHMADICTQLMDLDTVDRCERLRLTQVRRDMLRPKFKKKPFSKLTKSMMIT